MSTKPDLAELRKLIGRFEDYDRQLGQALQSGDVDAVLAAFETARSAKNDIKDFLSEHGSVAIHDRRLGDQVRKIRSNSGYAIDSVWKGLYDDEESPPQETPSRQDLEEAIFSFDPDNAPRTARRRQVGSLIVGQSTPPPVGRHLEQIKECYQFGLFEATVVFRRAVIEAALFEFAKRRGLIQTRPRVRDYAEYSLRDLGERAKQRLRRSVFEKALGEEGVVKVANHILHAKREGVHVTSGEALRSIRTTFEILEDLFGLGQGPVVCPA